MKKEQFFAWLALITTLLASDPAPAVESSDPPVLDKGDVRGTLAGGVSFINRVSDFSPELSLRVGLGARLEWAAPLALGLLLVDGGDVGGVVLGFGVSDLFVNENEKLLFSPTVVVGGKARLGRHASLFGAFDFTGVEQGVQRGDHSVWMRGSLALVIDFGAHATLSFGVAHQRIIADGFHPEGLEASGWAGDARVSFGAARAQPFSEIPTLSIHLQPYLDLITIARFDVDLHSATTNSLWLTGIEIRI